jgi:hypothetical protein
MASVSPTRLPAPKTGFMTWQFWLGLLAVVATFLLGQFGAKLPFNIQDIINRLPDGFKTGIVPGVVGVGIIAAFIIISSAMETRTIKRNGAAPHANIKTNKPFWSTSEFWLGAVTVVLNYLHDSGVFAPDVHNSTDTTTLVIALAYMFARSQIKQAYDNAKATGS